MPDDPIPTEQDLRQWFLGERRPDILALLKRGILEKRKVLGCLHGGGSFVFYPHALGIGQQRDHWLQAFVVMEAPDLIGEPFGSPLRWRWLPVAAIKMAQLADRWGSLPVNAPPPPVGVEITLEASSVL
jgi:hypothetical protein